MDVRTPFFQNIACVLIGVLFLNPIVSTAAQLTVDAQAAGNTALAQAGNGVPIVNIATPNGSGLSHNKFSDYNVGQQGLILNNATAATQSTQLGGLILGNPNFNGQAAGLILNEVTGANASQLKGYTEVAGKSAAVIVANPHGITCDGCGFINTPRATLTTGKPIVENGKLARFDVDGGQITIEGAGLNASNIEQFDLITRSAKINAELYANKLNVITGRNQVDADTLNATAKTDDGSAKPQLAIDSSALGGMYAGAIRLVGTEAGVGVKLAGDLAASAGDIQIDANGQLTLAQTAASQNLMIQAQGVDLTDNAYAAGNVDISAGSELANRKSLAAAGSIALQGGQLINQGAIEAGVNPDNSRNALGDVRLSGERLQNSGTVLANRELEVQVSQLLDNQAGTLSGKGHTQIDAGQLDNRAGRVLAGSTLNLAADAIDNRATGLIHSHGAADVQVAGALDNQQGQLVSEATLGLQAQQLNNQTGRVIAGDALQLNAQAIDNSAAGVISAQTGVQIEAQSLSNAQGGEVSAGAELGLDVEQLDNSDNGSISSVGALALQADTIANRNQGTISSEQALTLNATDLDSSAGGRVESRGDLQATLGNLKQQGGVLLSEGQLNVDTGAIDNSQSGLIHGRQGLQLHAGQVDNRDKGRISSQGALTANLSGLDQQGGGQFVSSGALTLDLAGGRLNNSRQGLLATPGSLLLKNVAAIDNSQGGEISSDRAFSLVTGELNNSSGKILSGEALELRITKALLNNLGGLLSAAKQLNLSAASLNNSSAGQISSVGDMQLSLAGDLNNSQQGLIGSQAALRIDAAHIDNHDQGELSSAGALQIEATSLNNRGGLVIGDTTLDLETSGLLDNSQQGVLAAGAAFSLKVGQLLNSDKGLIQGDAGLQATIQGAFDNSAGSLRTGSDLLLVSGSLDNSSGSLSSGGTLTLTSGALNNAKGTLASAGTSRVTSSGLNNDAGTLSSQGDLHLVSGAVSNRDGGVVVTAGQLQVQADSLDAGNGGRVVANGAADVQLDGQLDLSTGGQLLSGAALLLRAQTIDNSDQGLISGKGTTSVEATSIDNSLGGEISSTLGLTLVTDELDNRNKGRVIAEAGLKLVADRVLNSALGVLSAAHALDLQTLVLNNSGGRILSGALLSLSAEQIDNSLLGRISAGGDLLLVTQQLDNQQQGEVLSGGDLELRADSIDSHDQGLIASEGAMDIRVTKALDLSQGGQIIGEAALDLQAASLSTRKQGLIAANGELQVTATSVDNAEGGEISSQDSLTLEADSLDNSDGGRIIGEAGVNASLEQLDNSGNGLLASNAGLVLHAKQVDNSAGGTLSGVQLLTLNAETLNNQGAGRVLSGGALQLTLDKLNNSNAGLLSSRGDLLLQGTELDNRGGNILVDGQGKVVADSLDSSDGGQLSSVGDLDIEVKTLDQHDGGELLSNGQLDLRIDTLDNNGGLVSGLEGLSISADSLTNQGGELSTDADLSIQSTRLDNSAAGKVIAGNALSLTVAQLLNQAKGVLSGQHSLTLSGVSLDNSGAGLLVSQGAIDVTLTEALNNRDGGSLLAQGSLKLQAASLNNSQDGLLSSKAGMDLELTGDLNNQAGALIADGALQIGAQQLDNSQQGVLNSKGDLLLDVQGVDNSAAGSIASDAKLDLKAERLDNSQGQVASKGDLKVELDELLQQGGELLSQGKLTLNAGDIDNSQAGLIAATQGIDIVTGGLNNSAGGEISTQALASVRVQAAAGQPAALLDNSDAGLIIGDQGLTLTVQRLLNTAKGVLSGRDSLVLIGASLDNSAGGTLSSQKTLDVQLTGALDNHDKGALLSGGSLTVEAASLNNSAGGLLSSAGALTVDKAALNNQGGKLVSDGQLTITNGSLDNRNSGIISAKQALTIGTGQLDNQNKGLITTGAGLTVTAGQINNRDQGLIAGKGAAKVTATGVDQHAGGELISETSLTLDLQGGELNNSDKGLLATPGALLLNNLGKVDNSAGGEISSSQGFLLKASQLNNSAGRVISGQQLQLQITQALLNNLKGVLSAAKLIVDAASLNNAGAGVLASKGDIQLTLAGKLDNHDQGVISAAKALTLASASLDNSGDGLLASGGALTLTTGAANNQGGSIASQTTLTATTADLDNRNGVISSQQALTLTADAVDNRDNGLITSAAELTLTADSLDSSRELALSGGEVSAKGDLKLTVTQLIQQQGRLIGEAGVSLNLLDGDLDNRGGLLFAKGPLTLKNLDKLDNRGGEVSSSQGYSLDASEIDNGDQGKLISAGTLAIDLDAGKLRNAAGGLISGWQGLTVKAGNLDNSGAGTLSSRDGDLGVELSGALDNSDEGALVSKGESTVEAASLDNSAKGIVSSEGDLELTLAGKLNNSDGGLIDSQGTLNATAGEVDNGAGQLGSAKAATITAASLDNGAGQLSSNAALTLTLTGDLLNTQKAQLASAGPLVLKAAAIDNQGGSLVSQNLLHITASSLNNGNGGTLAARDALDIVLGSGVLTNSADGLIHSEKGALDIQAQSLNNNDGVLSSQQDLTLKLDGKLDNNNGQIESLAGNLDLQKSSTVDNSAGVLSSVTGWLKLVTAGLFDNDAGITQAQSLEIDANGIDNRSGHISALSGDTDIDLGTATFNNQGGGLYAHQLLKVIAGDFNNDGEQAGQGGKVAAETIDFSLSGALNNSYGILESASTLSLAAASIDNQNGNLRALGTSGDTSIAATSLDNRIGTIETANANLDLNVAGLQSSGGSILHVGTGDFGLSAAQVTGAGGDLSTNGLLTLTADNWTNSGVLQAGKLVLNIDTFTQTASGQLLAGQSFSGSGINWVNHGLLASDGTFSLNLSGAYSGSGQATSLGDLTLSAASIDLGNSTRIAGGGLTTVSATGLLKNLGKLTSAGDLTVTANTLSNYGTLGSAEKLRLVAPTLLNENGLIFSGDDMTLRVNNFTNKYADVYSLGALLVAKDDANNWSASLENISGTIESRGNMQLHTAALSNRKEKFELSEKLVSGDITYECKEHGGHCEGSHYDIMYYVDEVIERIVHSDSAAANIISGEDLLMWGNSFTNSHSLVSAAGNLSIDVSNFSNQGAAASTVVRHRMFRTPVDSESDNRFWDMVAPGGALTAYAKYNSLYVINYWDYVQDQDNWDEQKTTLQRKYQKTNQLNAYYDPNRQQPVPSRILGYSLMSSTETVTPTGAASNAVVQAGGNVQITAGTSFNNSVLIDNANVALGGSKVGNTAASGTGKSFVAQLNAQLPPDLQQQQINPLTLPGFSLPQGENGLFRLSGQQVQSSIINHAQSAIVDRTQAGSKITLGQQEQSLAAADAQGRSFTVVTQSGKAVEQVAASDWQSSNTEANLQTSGSVATVDAGTDQVQSALNGQSLPATATLPGSSEQIQRTSDQFVPGAVGGNLLVLVGDQAVGVEAPSAQTALLGAPALPQLVQGQNILASSPGSHKYLIETNPELTNLKQFLGSDYMLGNLGYTPDNTQKRLGDGLYEQRLIREAVVARTGQRFLAGLTSDEAMFRYLMDNAIASKQALNLSVGITLTAEQVAALTHDIVWMEEYEVNGEKVLVPVLYLAQAEGRLAANGALIQGQDVTLISGGDLLNQGTLRASNNLSAVAGGSIGNSGLIETGNRLELLATDSIRNAQGGIIAGRDVSLTALTGDVLNERTVARYEVGSGNRRTIQDFTDSAARIEAGNSLSLSAGRDVANLGGVFDSRGDLSIEAGRDVTIASVEERRLQARGGKYRNERVSQHGAQVSAGRDIEISAGRDLTAIASRIDAQRDISLDAGQDVTLAAAANESHFYSKSKKVTRSTDRVVQQASTVQAGRDIAIDAGEDLRVVASQVKAGNDIALDAEQDIDILSAKDESASFYSKKSKGSFGRSKSKQKEKYDSTNVASVIEAGNDLTLNTSKAADGSLSIDGGRDVTVIGSQLSAGNDLLVGATGDVAVLSGVEEHGSYSKKSKSGFLGLSKSGKSQLKTKASQVASELEAGNDVVIAAGNDIRLRASETTAGNDVELRAGLVTDTGDINLVSANDTAYSLKQEYKQKFGPSLSGGMLSFASAKKAGQEAQSSTSVGSQVNADRDATLNAERDINIVGSGISAGRNVALGAGRDVNVLAGSSSNTDKAWEESQRIGIALGMKSSSPYTSEEERIYVGDAYEATKNVLDVSTDSVAPSLIQSGEDMAVNAGRDIQVKGSQLLAGGDATLDAVRDIRVISSTHTLEVAETDKTQNYGGGLLKSPAKGPAGIGVMHDFDYLDGYNLATKHTEVYSAVSAEGDLSLNSGRDTEIAGGNLVADNVNIDAGRDIRIDSPENNDILYRDVMQGGAGLAVGLRPHEEDADITSPSIQPSSIVATEGDINLNAGQDVKIEGASLLAERDVVIEAVRDAQLNGASVSVDNHNNVVSNSMASVDRTDTDFNSTASAPLDIQAGRDVSIEAGRDVVARNLLAEAGRDIDIIAGRDLTIGATERERSSSSDSLSIKGDVFGLGEMARAFSEGKSGSEILSAAAQANPLLNNINNISKTDKDEDKWQNAAVLGYRLYSGNPSAGSGEATGASTAATYGFDLSRGINGRLGYQRSKSEWNEQSASQLAAGRDLYLEAGQDLALVDGTQASAVREAYLVGGRDIVIRSAENTSKERSSGGGITVGYNGGWYVGVDGNASRGDTAQYQNASVTAGQTLVSDSGRDTTITGGNLHGGDVHMSVGRNLELLSEQGSIEQQSASASFTVGSRNSASASASVRDRLAVDRPATITADDQLRIDVAQNTHLKGSQIDSATGNLELVTETLSYENLKNHDTASQGSVSYSGSSDGDTWGNGGKAQEGTGYSAGVPIAQLEGGDTRAAIGEGTIRNHAGEELDTGISRDVAGAHEETDSAAISEYSAKSELLGIVAQEGFEAVGDYANKQVLEAEYKAKQAEASGNASEAAYWRKQAEGWKEGSVNKVLLHAVVGALLGEASGFGAAVGGASAAANQALNGYIYDALKEQGLVNGESSGEEDKVRELIALAIGGLVGSSNGAALAGAGVTLNADKYNRQLHPDERMLAKKLAEQSDGQYTAEQIEEQLRLSYVNGTNVTPGSDAVVTKDGIYDPSGNWIELGNGYFLQQFANLDVELVSYIQKATDSYFWAGYPKAPAYDWSKTPSVGDEKRDRLTGYVIDEAGKYRVPVVIDGEPFSPRFDPCGTTDCVVAGANIDYSDPETQRWIAAGNAKAVKDAANIGLTLAPLPGAGVVGRFLAGVFGRNAKGVGNAVPDVISPTYRELQGLNKGFQAHHTLPQYLGKMLGYTKKDMMDHPATLITQYSHTGKLNPDAMHKAIGKYLPPMVGGRPAVYTSDQIKVGLQRAYADIGRPELFESIKHLIK